MPTSFSDCIDQIAERSAGLRDAVISAGDIELRVPGCPDWTLRDLVVHVGQVQRSWAGNVQAGGPSAGPVTDVPTHDLLEWSAASTQTLIDALQEAGPDAPCWTWWEDSNAPSNAGAVARHQVQEAALHAWDAQSAIGPAEDLPSDIAIDCVDEFLVVSLGAMGEWPHPPTRIDVVATVGPRWTVQLTSVAKVEEQPSGQPAATVTASASDLILAIYSRTSLELLGIDGDRKVVELLVNWARISIE